MSLVADAAIVARRLASTPSYTLGVVIVRVPAADPTGTLVRVTARLLNRAGQTMRALEAGPGVESPTQFALPLASLAPGQYEIEVTGENRYGVVSDRVAFRVES